MFLVLPPLEAVGGGWIQWQWTEPDPILHFHSLPTPLLSLDLTQLKRRPIVGQGAYGACYFPTPPLETMHPLLAAALVGRDRIGLDHKISVAIWLILTMVKAPYSPKQLTSIRDRTVETLPSFSVVQTH